MTNRVWGEGYLTTMVCIDSCEHDIMAGRIYNPYIPDGLFFESLMQFVSEMETALDEIDKKHLSQKSINVIDFSATDKGSYTPGALATFAVRVLFRQNASWQGCVTWLEGKEEQSFRSALEFIMLINQVIKSNETHSA